MVTDPSLIEALCAVPVESVIHVDGHVRERASGATNAAMKTGQVEVNVEAWSLLNAANATLPFYASQCHDSSTLPKDTLRAKHRYLDLRRAPLRDAIRTRSRMAQAARNFLHDNDFIEIETPILLRSTPEGAREFLVPTRHTPGPQFYALQQSPQQPKQLLMVSGVTDRYFQFAKCFRDEDGRKDRQPEFTQIDIEMSFVRGHGDNDVWRIGGADVRDITQGLVQTMWTAAGHAPLPASFPVYTYEHVMRTYGSDKPDLRFGLPIENLCSAGASHVLDVLIVPRYPHCALTGKQIQALMIDQHGDRVPVEHFKGKKSDPQALAALLCAKSHHMAAMPEAFDAASLADTLASMMERAYAFADDASTVSSQPEDTYHVFVSRRPALLDGGSTVMGDLRLRIADLLSLRSKEPRILWVTEFPLFTHADADKDHLAHGRWSSTHHPFTAPVAADIPKLQKAFLLPPAERDATLATIHGQHYDLVLNGAEIGGGSVRIHDPTLQLCILRDVLALSEEEQQRFSHLLHALECGAPPHAGIALGFDRFMAIACDTTSIRDVMAFPKSGSSVDPLFSTPAPLPMEEQHDQLAIYNLQPTK
ncbi:aspartate--tRNA ligase Msd1 [Malassezia pachydermatis]|uniref:Aspartate--trna mitochondrial n=1 Tax=Malassezia pachydermatis TaxID=77020 RepID=A0A0M8MTI4_9BASI|nr:aspartate--trna mitochondrial [Malassezia pachydermatis]KOS13311.1 aspartate--trna mitochondrial [Malassezia pachydermatis]